MDKLTSDDLAACFGVHESSLNWHSKWASDVTDASVGVPEKYQALANDMCERFEKRWGRSVQMGDMLQLAGQALHTIKPYLSKFRHFTELMSGVKSYTRAMLSRGKCGRGFDPVNDSSESIVTLAGLIWCAVMISEIAGGATKNACI
eukprot:12431239-Karenia_brevis.AAC.1